MLHNLVRRCPHVVLVNVTLDQGKIDVVDSNGGAWIRNTFVELELQKTGWTSNASIKLLKTAHFRLQNHKQLEWGLKNWRYWSVAKTTIIIKQSIFMRTSIERLKPVIVSIFSVDLKICVGRNWNCCFSQGSARWPWGVDWKRVYHQPRWHLQCMCTDQYSPVTGVCVLIRRELIRPVICVATNIIWNLRTSA